MYLVSENSLTKKVSWAVVVAQLVERSLPLPEDPTSNPVNGILNYLCSTYQLYLNDVKKARGRERSIFKETECSNYLISCILTAQISQR